LFWIQTLKGSLIGHLGLYRFDFKKQSCEIDNVVRGRKNIMPGIMTLATKSLLNWSFSALGLKVITLRVFSDNERAMALYQRCGFKKVKDIPLKKIVKGGNLQWVEMSRESKKKAERYFTQLRLTKSKNNIINKI
jgi:RimJ/RimL family protein N-acetyltransferase